MKTLKFACVPAIFGQDCKYWCHRSNRIWIGKIWVILDSILTFGNYFDELWIKTSQKLYALARVSNCMDADKVKMIIRSFIMLHSSPLIWMFHDRAIKMQLIKFMRERCELYQATLNPPLINLWQKIIHYQFTKETYSYLW